MNTTRIPMSTPEYHASTHEYHASTGRTPQNPLSTLGTRRTDENPEHPRVLPAQMKFATKIWHPNISSQSGAIASIDGADWENATECGMALADAFAHVYPQPHPLCGVHAAAVAKLLLFSMDGRALGYIRQAWSAPRWLCAHVPGPHTARQSSLGGLDPRGLCWRSTAKVP